MFPENIIKVAGGGESDQQYYPMASYNSDYDAWQNMPMGTITVPK